MVTFLFCVFFPFYCSEKKAAERQAQRFFPVSLIFFLLGGRYCRTGRALIG